MGVLQVRFSQEGLKSFPKFTSENLKNKRLEDECLAGSHLGHPQGLHRTKTKNLVNVTKKTRKAPVLKPFVL